MKEDTTYIDLLKVILTVGIVFRHSAPDPALCPPPIAMVVNCVVLLSELCVPLFFALSGYLFFYNAPSNHMIQWFGGKLKRRFFSLLIPYLIAVAVAFLAYRLVLLFGPDILSGYLGDRWKDPVFVLWSGPINLSLWFIRELIIVTLLSPIIWLIIRFTSYFGVVALGLLWYLGFCPAPWFLFSLGACLSFKNVGAAEGVGHSGPYFLLSYICCYVAAMNCNGFINLTILTGLPMMVWIASKLVVFFRIQLKPSIRAWCFFIYLYHYLPLVGLKKLVYSDVGNDTIIEGIVKYIVVAMIILAVLTVFYLLMRKVLPKVMRVIVGGK